MSDYAFAGKTFEVRVDNGVIFRNTYSADGSSLHYVDIAGEQEGASEEVDLHSAEIAPGQYLVGWNELSGMAVTHVMDFNTGTIHAFWSSDAGSRRTGEIHTATFKEVR